LICVLPLAAPRRICLGYGSVAFADGRTALEYVDRGEPFGIQKAPRIAGP
jgi:hypothetical protein